MSGYYNQYGYSQNGYYSPPPQQQQLSPPPQQQFQDYRRSPFHGIPTSIYGLVVGVSFDSQKDYLFYSKNFNDFIRIDRSYQGIQVGKWFTIEVNYENYAGDFVLNHMNIRSCEINTPHHHYIGTRFFPERHHNPDIGELLVAARFCVRANRNTRNFEYVSYEIEENHLVDHYDLIKNSASFYDGRSFIVETQASMDGFVVLKVHEDTRSQLRCDHLPDTVVPYNARLLDDTCLMTIMTGHDGTAPLPENISNSHSQMPKDTSHPRYPTSNYQNYENRSTSSRSPFEAASSMSSETLADLRSASEPELRALASDPNDTRETTLVNSRSTVTRRRSVPTPLPSEDSDEEDEDTLKTRGTKNLLRREFIPDVSKAVLERCYTEKPLMKLKDPVLCVVVLKMPNCAILYAVKNLIQNILVLDSCEGVTEPLKVGDVAFFEISDRRLQTKDSILPKASYSHIAVRMKPITDDSRAEMNQFKKSVRTFGGLLEVKVRIDLREKGNVEEYYDIDQTVKKTEEERKLYLLKVSKDVWVTIPKARLVSSLTVALTADFELVAWAVHRRSIGNVALHIDRNGEVIKYGEKGASLLPPLSDDFRNVKK